VDRTKSTQPELATLIENARGVRMSDADRAAQRLSFAYGNVALENPRVTRAVVAELADRAKHSK
jgi:hypothetical protein